MSTTRIAMVGLPGTGKTTYLGALWHMAEEPSVADIREADLPVDPRHIQEVARKVRAMEEIPRTSHDDDHQYEGAVEFEGGGTVTLSIRDRSGEQLQALIERRQWPELLAHEIEAASALLLFVSEDHLILPLSLRLAELLPHPETEAQPAGAVDLGAAASEQLDGSANRNRSGRRRSGLKDLLRLQGILPVCGVMRSSWCGPRGMTRSWR